MPRTKRSITVIDPQDGLHKAMAALPWPILKAMLFPSKSRPPPGLRLVSAEPSESDTEKATSSSVDPARKR